jgi:hypothetical protein
MGGKGHEGNKLLVTSDDPFSSLQLFPGEHAVKAVPSEVEILASLEMLRTQKSGNDRRGDQLPVRMKQRSAGVARGNEYHPVRRRGAITQDRHGLFPDGEPADEWILKTAKNLPLELQRLTASIAPNDDVFLVGK